MADIYRINDLDLDIQQEEVLDVLDLPQIYTKPSAQTLLDTLSLLSLEPRSWDTTPLTSGINTPRSSSGATTPALRAKPKVRPEGIPQYLTRIVSSPLAWIDDDDTKEEVWDAASLRLSERSGRTAMGAISRHFRIPIAAEPFNGDSTLQTVISSSAVQDNTINISIHEPALTEDNLGLKTWASSFVLAKKWHALRQDLPLKPAKDGSVATILELGAGTGLVGIAAAAVLQASVLLTDLPAIVPNLHRNIESNSNTIDSRGGSAQAAILDWTVPEEIIFPQEDCPRVAEQSTSSYHIIVAADPIYSKEQPGLLVQTIGCHLARTAEARVIIEIPIREAYAEERADLKNRMRTLGLDLYREETEIGYDDWSEGQGEELSEVECWMGMWKWTNP